jgi:hypothetical protein
MAVASSSWEHYHITYRYINPRFFPQRNQRMIQRNRQLHSRAWGSGEQHDEGRDLRQNKRSYQ